ncbi:hypothetical protein D3C76_1369510 [compost metagenome]
MGFLFFLFKAFKLSSCLLPRLFKRTYFILKAAAFRTCALHLLLHMPKLMLELLQITGDSLLFQSFLIAITAQVLQLHASVLLLLTKSGNALLQLHYLPFAFFNFTA